MLNSIIFLKISFSTRLSDICKSNYVPTIEDVLHSRQKTVGIIEKKYEKDSRKLLFGKFFLNIVDVGGQRNERYFY
jgi:hypothetical protein